MSELFDRLAILEVGPTGQGFTINTHENLLRVTFDVEKTIHSDTNKATIEIYNLAVATRGRLKIGDVVRLRAGYKSTGKTDIIYEGAVTHLRPGARTDRDIVSTLECGDGDEEFSTQNISKTFSKGTSIRSIILAVAKEFTEAHESRDDEKLVTFGQLAKSPPKKERRISVKNLTQKGGDLAVLEESLRDQGFATTLRRPMSVSGNAAEVLTRLSQIWRFDWSVQDGELQVLAYGKAAVGLALMISKDSGLIGIPEVTESGVKFTSLILPTLRPGSVIELKSSVVEGTYRCERIKFSGDSRGDSWNAEIEAGKMS